MKHPENGISDLWRCLEREGLRVNIFENFKIVHGINV
jgi:hypothetical protein